jgi:ribosomal protein L19E
MALRKSLGRILLAALLQVGALSGMKMTPEDIEKIMNTMHRTKVVKIVKQDDDVRE